MAGVSANTIIARYQRARGQRGAWEVLWQECYELALPLRESAVRTTTPGKKRSDRLFDGTAPDAVDQLAASLMAELTPPWSRWFGFAVGPEVSAESRVALGSELERAAFIMHAHFDRSNFAAEMHQCYLDLVTAGTACLLLEEAPLGEPSAFRFTAVPLASVVLEESASGALDITYRLLNLSAEQICGRFQRSSARDRLLAGHQNSPDVTFPVVEAVFPEPPGYRYVAVADATSGREPTVLAEGNFSSSPFINFRWMKAPGEVYGRSPVMKCLPDIKTANKVVELILKNASIAVTGIWQADDDGVINPANIKLVPGAIIPKAVGSAGLTPLESPGRFDVSQLVLDQLHSRIRKALFVDKLGPIHGPRMTATEVLERSAEMARVLGATYGRLQSELLSPIIIRARSILARRGEIPDRAIDHQMVALEYKSPQARIQAQQSIQNTLIWLDAVARLGPEAASIVDTAATAQWLGRSLYIPEELMRDPTEIASSPFTRGSETGDADGTLDAQQRGMRAKR